MTWSLPAATSPLPSQRKILSIGKFDEDVIEEPLAAFSPASTHLRTCVQCIEVASQFLDHRPPDFQWNNAGRHLCDCRKDGIR